MTSPLREPHRLRLGDLTVLHDPMPGPLTAIAVAVRAGSRYDGAHPGIAHLTEHMLFQGTRRLDQATLNRRAGELGGEHDADTGYEDVTIHFEVFNEDVEDALGLLAEQLFHSTVPADRLAKEQRVVVDEIRGRQEDPANYVHEHAWRRFVGEPLGHPVCGTITSVRRITCAAVRAFLARHFVPANMVFAACGGISRDGLRRALRRTFPTGGPRARAAPPLPRRGGTGALRLRRRDLTQAYLVRLMTVPCEPRAALALSLALEIVGADPDARLFQEVRERLGLGYDLGATVEQGRDWAVAVLSASAARDDERRLRETVARVCREAAAGFGSEELARARKKVRYRFTRLADSRQDRAASHATRAACGLPSLARAARVVADIGRAEVEAAWRAALVAPSLTAVLSG
ncbi:MAG TPA: pitrilysin family protein [Candidatus Binatia bacterium]|nr:pitrilysin family protein [Candidatus Binatia bacterium]